MGLMKANDGIWTQLMRKRRLNQARIPVFSLFGDRSMDVGVFSGFFQVTLSVPDLVTKMKTNATHTWKADNSSLFYSDSRAEYVWFTSSLADTHVI
jgi:hypothetical protein